MESVVEIDENERYWVGQGYGKRGFLPSDRGSYSTLDGSLSWSSTAEASEDLVLLGRGWRYKEGSEFTPAGNWMYASDFREESIKNAKPDGGMTKFVRFRRLFRFKVFNPEEFVGRETWERCNQVDSSATDTVSRLLLDVFAYCTLLHNPSSLTDAVALPLKQRVINVAISQETPPANAAPDVLDASFQLQLLRKKLESFVEEERASTIMNRLLTSVEFTFENRALRKEFKQRQTRVDQVFPSTEREAIACLIIKKLDPLYQLHCEKPECGEKCRFYRIQCPNDGCSDIVSRLYMSQHDQVCRYKIVTCECGDTYPRHESASHKVQACKLREVECPFKNIGCIKAIKACDVQKHVVEDGASHLLLAVNRMLEHEEVIKKLHTKVLILEEENKELKQTIAKHEKESRDEVSNLESKLAKTSKELSMLEATCKIQFSPRQSLRD
jgi:hypothetical protein